jgi:hypothetical protein
MSPLVYLDNNFVITAHDGPEQYKGHLRELVAKTAATFVLSPWHWPEMARDTNYERGSSVADFCDSLNPAYLYDRRSIQKREAASAFFRSAGIHADAPTTVGDISDIIYDLIGTRAHRKCKAFVEHLRQVGQDHPLAQTFERAPEVNAKNTGDFLAGRFTKDFLAKSQRLYVRTLLPTITPAGVAIDEGTKQRFLDSYNLNELPSTTLEWKITTDSWALGRRLGENNLVDQQHVSAVPYVDLFVTDDNKLTNLIKRAIDAVTFRTAELLTKAEFDKRFPIA